MKNIITVRFQQLFSSQLRLNMLSGSMSMGFGIFVSAVKYPLYLRFLGYEKYGAWLLLSTVLTFAQLGLLGIAPAIIKLVAEEYGKNNLKAVQEYFASAVWMLMLVGIVLVTGSIFFKCQIVSVMGLTGENSALVGSLLTYMAVLSVWVLVCQVLSSVLAGVGRIDIANYSQAALQVVPLLVSIPLLMANKGVVSLLLANIFAYIAVFLFIFIRLNRLINLDLRSITLFSWHRLQKMLTFGGCIFAGSMFNMMVLPITKIVISRFIGVGMVPVFELAYRVSLQVRSIFEVAFRALMPEISKLSSDGNRDSTLRMRKIISKAYRFLFFGAVPVYMLAYILADVVFKVWLGENFLPSIPGAFRIMLLVTFISLIGVIPYYICMGHGRVRNLLIHHFVYASGILVSIGISVGIFHYDSLVSIAWCYVPGAVFGTGYLLLSSQNKSSPKASLVEDNE